MNTIGHNSKDKTLSQYALEIRDLLSKIATDDKIQESRRVKIGNILLEIINKKFPTFFDLTSKESRKQRNSFYEWCEKNIKGPNGEVYGKGRIDSFIFMVRHPEHTALKVKRRTPIKSSGAVNNITPTHDQVNLLISAWEQTGNEARDEFMKLIGLRYK